MDHVHQNGPISTLSLVFCDVTAARRLPCHVFDDVTGRVGAASRGVYPADIDPVWCVMTSQDELERRREECIQLILTLYGGL